VQLPSLVCVDTSDKDTVGEGSQLSVALGVAAAGTLSQLTVVFEGTPERVGAISSSIIIF